MLEDVKNREKDKEGFYVREKKRIRGIPANFMDVTRDDEILASQNGYTASQNIEIMRCNYHGERYLVDEGNGDAYEVKRTFGKNKGNTLVLTCERRQSGEV